MGAVDAPGDPLLHHEALADRPASPRRSIDGILRTTSASRLGVDREIDVAAAAGVHLAHDPVAVELHARFEQRRQRQLRRPAPNTSLASPSGTSSIRTICTVRLSGAALAGRPPRRSPARRASRSSALSPIALAMKRGADMLVHAVGRQQEDVAALDRERLVVDLDLRIDAHRPAEIALLRRDARRDDRWSVAPARCPRGDRCASRRHEKGARSADLMHHGAQGADVALVLVVGVLAAPRLRMQPGIGRRDHALRRGLHRPGFRRAVVVGEEALDGRLGWRSRLTLLLLMPSASTTAMPFRLEQRLAAGSGRRENPDWSPCGPCRNAARPRSSVRAAFSAPTA